jgi:predicted nucleic-acid-binding protein
MIGLDTNVLLRYLVQDDPTQSPKATEIIERRLTIEDPGFVSLVCVLEIVWVLGNLYKRSRAQIADHVEMMLAADTLEVQNEQEVYQAVIALRNGSGTFQDALIGALGSWRGCSATLTFDQNAAKRLNRFQLCQPAAFRS